MTGETRFSDLCEVMEKLESTKKRGAMVSEAAELLRRLLREELIPATLFLTGKAFPSYDERTLDVSGATLWRVVLRAAPAKPEDLGKAFEESGDFGDAVKSVLSRHADAGKQGTLLFRPPLSILEVKRQLDELAAVSGEGSRKRKERVIEGLLARATPLEAKFLVRMILGEMRTGFQEGLLVESVSKAFNVPSELARRAVMIAGDIGIVAVAAKDGGEAALDSMHVKPFRVIKPMLAAGASSVQEALSEHGGTSAFEYKLDGARVQIHILEGAVRIWSRRLTEVTESLLDIVQLIRANLKVHSAILEGEVVAIGRAGRPLPFQHLMRRFRRKHDVDNTIQRIPAELYLFDLLFIEGESLIDKPYTERRKRLSELTEKLHLVKSLVTSDTNVAEKLLSEALELGHEGLVAKSLNGTYTPGTRGKKWLKIKQVMEPLDLVITEAEYGYGKRHQWLSDYTLSTRDEETGKFMPIGKTFKGLTDEEIKEMTARLKSLMLTKRGRKIILKPEVVVEVAFNEIQESPKYKSGMALRFARITRIRLDKSPEEADTIKRVRDLYEGQFLHKASL
ncbi:MAG: ATP-dependent DNA ligase [Promethearchaeati archaeon SRVP18_Atabeyarchaeia-1]